MSNWLPDETLVIALMVIVALPCLALLGVATQFSTPSALNDSSSSAATNSRHTSRKRRCADEPRALCRRRRWTMAPRGLYEMLDRQFSFTVDACAVRSNTKHPRFWSPKENGLAQSWEGRDGVLQPAIRRAAAVVGPREQSRPQPWSAIACLVLPAVLASWWRARHAGVDATRVADSVARSRYRAAQPGALVPVAEPHRGRAHLPGRVLFDGMEDGAPFDTALVVMASPNRKPPKPKAIELGVDRFSKRVAHDAAFANGAARAAQIRE